MTKIAPRNSPQVTEIKFANEDELVEYLRKNLVLMNTISPEPKQGKIFFSARISLEGHQNLRYIKHSDGYYSES